MLVHWAVFRRSRGSRPEWAAALQHLQFSRYRSAIQGLASRKNPELPLVGTDTSLRRVFGFNLGVTETVDQTPLPTDCLCCKTNGEDGTIQLSETFALVRPI
jgi:hypothetical protein